MSSLSEKYANLRYIGPKFRTRDVIDQALESILLNSIRLNILGKENIPVNGPLVVVFMPHSGWIETTAIDHVLRSVRQPAVWGSKIENIKDLPSFIKSDRRLIYIDRTGIALSFMKTALKVLQNANGVLASALEGTRASNPDDTGDLLYLGKAHHGLIRIAMKTGANILPTVVLGSDQILPRPKEIKMQFGTKGVIFELGKAIMKNQNEKPELLVDILPPIQVSTLTGLSSEQITDNIVRESLIPNILKHNKDYPLGVYAD